MTFDYNIQSDEYATEWEEYAAAIEEMAAAQQKNAIHMFTATYNDITTWEAVREITVKSESRAQARAIAENMCKAGEFVGGVHLVVEPIKYEPTEKMLHMTKEELKAKIREFSGTWWSINEKSFLNAEDYKNIDKLNKVIDVMSELVGE